MKRLVPHIPLPPYIFIPGINPHPKKESGHMEGKGDPIASQIDPDHPEDNEFLRYSIDLYNHGFYWESHVYFEALWNAHNRQGAIADLMKGMIKLGAAGVKINIDQTVAALGHFDRAMELFESVKASEGERFIGFDLVDLIRNINKVDKANPRCFEVYPSWE